MHTMIYISCYCIYLYLNKNCTICWRITHIFSSYNCFRHTLVLCMSVHSKQIFTFLKKNVHTDMFSIWHCNKREQQRGKLQNHSWSEKIKDDRPAILKITLLPTLYFWGVVTMTQILGQTWTNLDICGYRLKQSSELWPKFCWQLAHKQLKSSLYNLFTDRQTNAQFVHRWTHMDRFGSI